MTIKGSTMGFQVSSVGDVFVVPVFGLQSREHHASLPTLIQLFPFAQHLNLSSRYYIPPTDLLQSCQYRYKWFILTLATRDKP